jgi:ATP-dependent Clp protease ATP-binding subunit ClpX
MVSSEKSKKIGQWISLGESVEQLCFHHRMGGRLDFDENKDPRVEIASILAEIHEKLNDLVDGKSFGRLIGVDSDSKPPDQWFLAVGLVFHFHYIHSGIDAGLPEQTLANKINLALSDKPHELVWATREVLKKMMDKGVLIKGSDGVGFGIILKRFVDGETEKKIEEKVSKPSFQEKFEEYLAGLSKLTPAQMAEGVFKAGYVGQEAAVRSVCLAVYRHFRHISRCHIGEVDHGSLPPPPHLLLSGETGVGKTYLLQTLFHDVLGYDNVSFFDCGSVTQVGFVGGSIYDSLSQLLEQNSGNTQISQTGIVVLDEIDKICFRAGGSEQESVRASTTGVQQSLLKMMERSRIDLNAHRQGRSNRPMFFETGGVLFICLGAFPHHRKKKRHIPIGFESNENISVVEKTATKTDFVSLGIMRELYGRFSQVVEFEKLKKSDMRKILSDQVVSRFRKELLCEGIGLSIDEKVFDLLIDQALDLRTGGRGLQRALGVKIQDAMFDAYSQKGNAKEIQLRYHCGEICQEVTTL